MVHFERGSEDFNIYCQMLPAQDPSLLNVPSTHHIPINGCKITHGYSLGLHKIQNVGGKSLSIVVILLKILKVTVTRLFH